MICKKSAQSFRDNLTAKTILFQKNKQKPFGDRRETTPQTMAENQLAADGTHRLLPPPRTATGERMPRFTPSQVLSSPPLTTEGPPTSTLLQIAPPPLPQLPPIPPDAAPAPAPVSALARQFSPRIVPVSPLVRSTVSPIVPAAAIAAAAAAGPVPAGTGHQQLPIAQRRGTGWKVTRRRKPGAKAPVEIDTEVPFRIGFWHEDGRVCLTSTLTEFCDANRVSKGSISELNSGYKQVHAGWRIVRDTSVIRKLLGKPLDWAPRCGSYAVNPEHVRSVMAEMAVKQ